MFRAHDKVNSHRSQATTTVRGTPYRRAGNVLWLAFACGLPTR